MKPSFLLLAIGTLVLMVGMLAMHAGSSPLLQCLSSRANATADSPSASTSCASADQSMQPKEAQ